LENRKSRGLYFVGNGSDEIAAGTLLSESENILENEILQNQ
jgi:hypothetical protein